MVMDFPVEFCAKVRATPGAVVGWLHALIDSYAESLPRSETLVFGPHTYVGDEPSHFETVALYAVDKRMAQDVEAREVVLSVTLLPLRHPVIGLDLRVWPLLPATLETLKSHFSDYFTQASPVFSSAAALFHARGTSVLACNRWLLEQLKPDVLADPQALTFLYLAWLEQYRALRGDYPADPRRGFRAILANKQRRIAKDKTPKE
jgi:hypothetical protein